MKHLYHIAWIVLALGSAGTAVLFALLPDTVPVHYNFAGQTDRMGSKYEYIVFPCLAAVACAIFLPLAKRVRRKQEDGYELAEKVLIACAIGEILLFNGLGFYFMWKIAMGCEAAMPAIPVVDGMRMLSFVLGVLLIILGSVMPKAKRNAFFGIRTKWSMSSDEVWRKSQRFGAFASVAAGALLLVVSAFLHGSANLLAQTVILALWIIACIAASYRYYQQAA